MKEEFDKILSKVKENWEHYKIEFKNCFNDLKSKDTFYKQIPNLLTASRAIGIIPVNILFLTGNMIPGMVLLGLLLSTDFIDGKIARKYGIVTKFGADLDAVCDKIMAIGLLIPLLFASPILIINLLLEVIISVINVSGRLKGIDTKTLFSGKVKTCFLSLTLGMGYLMKFIPTFYHAFILSSIITIPAQIKTILDYKKYVSAEEEINEVINSQDRCNEPVLSDREQKIKDLQREKEFLLSTKNNVMDKPKVKKRKKGTNK